MDYFEKNTAKPKDDLTWNIPELRQGSINIIGGNSQSFRTEVKTAEFMTGIYPLEKVNLVLPDALKSKLPPLDNFRFVQSTESGSFADTPELTNIVNAADFDLILGDLSKNRITGQSIMNASIKSEKPLLFTRDSVDLLAENSPDRLLMHDNVILFASMPQLQKLFRAVYYPKVLLLSQSLVQVADALHKFTLSYPVKLITLHSEQILLAENGSVKAIPLEHAGYSPIMLWQGELAAKISALNLYNPHNFLAASTSAIFS